jgi:hypothetical protein
VKTVNVLLWFDVEDYITKESDDALYGLLELLDSLSIKGTFKIVGQKVRRLEENRRDDIFARLNNHGIGFHTDLHSYHPTVSEYLEAYGFRDGVQKFEATELPGLQSLQKRVSKTARCYGQAGYSWAPQAFPTLRHWGLPVYLDCHDQVRLDGVPFWYGGVLNLTDIRATMRMELEEGGLDKAIQVFDKHHQARLDDGGFISIFYHPCEFATKEFWDGHNYALGANTPKEQWRIPPLRSGEEMKHYLEMLGEFLRYTLTKEQVRYITADEALALAHAPQVSLGDEEIREIAADVGQDLYFTVHNHKSISASDLFMLFYKYLCKQPFPAEMLYGPEQHVDSDFVGSVKVRDIIQAISSDRCAYPSIYLDKQLPDAFTVAGQRVNPVDMACTLAYIIAHDLSEEDSVAIVKGTLKSAQHAKKEVLWGPKWVVFPPEFTAPNIVSLSELQTWTLKPALF